MDFKTFLKAYKQLLMSNLKLEDHIKFRNSTNINIGELFDSYIYIGQNKISLSYFINNFMQDIILEEKKQIKRYNVLKNNYENLENFYNKALKYKFTNLNLPQEKNKGKNIPDNINLQEEIEKIKLENSVKFYEEYKEIKKIKEVYNNGIKKNKIIFNLLMVLIFKLILSLFLFF